MTVTELYQNGTMEFLMKKGFVKPCDINMKLYVECVSELQKRGMNKTQSVNETAEICKTSTPVVWRALKRWDSL